LATVIVKETGEPPFTDDCDADMASARSAASAPTLIVALPLALQPPLVMVTPRVSVGPLPAVKTMAFVPCPLVIAPPVIVHANVVPAGPTVTLAALPVEPGATFDGAVMFATGAGESATVFDVLALQPAAFVTVTLYAPGGTLIVCVVEPVDQRYDVKPAPASSVALVFGQTDDGPLIVTTGGGVMLTDCVALPLQPPALTTIVRTTLPLVPEVKLMLFVP
jgi:hypothetical protein